MNRREFIQLMVGGSVACSLAPNALAEKEASHYSASIGDGSYVACGFTSDVECLVEGTDGALYRCYIKDGVVYLIDGWNAVGPCGIRNGRVVVG